MRKQAQQLLRALLVFLRSDPHKKGAVCPTETAVYCPCPMRPTPVFSLSKYAVLGLQKIFKEGVALQKSGSHDYGISPYGKTSVEPF